MTKNGCKVFSFDPSMNMEKHWRNESNLFEPIGIGVFNGVLDDPAKNTLFKERNVDKYPVETLKHIMDRHGHDHLTMVRMDFLFLSFLPSLLPSFFVVSLSLSHTLTHSLTHSPIIKFYPNHARKK